MELQCKSCGKSFKRALFAAVLINLGCRTSDPNYCPSTEDHEHDWQDVAKEGE